MHTSTDIWKICGVVRYEKVIVLEDASSGLKRDKNRLMMEVLAVPAPPTSKDPCKPKQTLHSWHSPNSLFKALCFFPMQTRICHTQYTSAIDPHVKGNMLLGYSGKLYSNTSRGVTQL